MNAKKLAKIITDREERTIILPIPKGKKGSLDIHINLLSAAAKQLKVIGALVFFLSLPVAVKLLGSSLTPATMYPVEPKIEIKSPAPVRPEVSACRMGGGTWKKMPNACGDQCGQEKLICAQVITEDCDCGDYDCWDGEKCVLNLSLEASASSQKLR